MCITNSFLRQKSLNQHFCADVLHLQLRAKMTWELVHRRWVAPPWQCCRSFCSVCANFPAKKATTVAPQPSGSCVSLYIFIFFKTQPGNEGKEISWHQHDQEQLQAILAAFWTQKLANASNSDSRTGLTASSLGNTLQATPQGLKKCGHKCGETKKKICLRFFNHPSEFLTQIRNGSHN